MRTGEQEAGEAGRRESIAIAELAAVIDAIGNDLNWTVFDGERDWSWPHDRARIFELAELENLDRDPGDPYVTASFEPVELGEGSDSVAGRILTNWDMSGDYSIKDEVFERAVDGARFRLLSATRGDSTIDVHLLVDDAASIAILKVAVL